MFTRLAALLICAAVLGGCVLESKTPIIATDAGEALLDGYGLSFVSYGLRDGEWRKDNETFQFVPKGHHYEVSSGGDTMDIAFAKLDGSWWVMQAQEPGKQATYVLVDARKAELFLYALACKPLKDAGKYDSYIAFKDDDCVVKDGADTTALFKAIAADPGPQTAKIVPKG